MRVRLKTGCVILALALPGTALGAIELYGNAHVSLDAVGNGRADATDPDAVTDIKRHAFLVSSNKSWIGLRGREGLRDRLAVIWQVEQGVDIDDGGWADEGRDSFVGLETGFGTVLAGRHVTPYRRLTDRLDIFRHTRADHSAVVGAVDGVSLFNERARNILYYMTPEDRRIRFALAYISNLHQEILPIASDASDLNGYSASLVFDSGPLYFGIGYERLGMVEDPGREDAQAMKAAVGWDFGQGTRVSLVWESADDGSRIGAAEGTRDAWHASVAHVAGNFTWKLAYGMLDELDHTPDSGAHLVALGFSYAMSPRTDLYLLGAAMLNDDAARYALHPDHDDRGSVIPPAAAGNDVMAISAGVIHRFSIGL